MRCGKAGSARVPNAATGQLKEAADPCRLVLPAGRETLADYYANELRTAIGAGGLAPGARSYD
ncbi:hypothetical protein H4W80_009180 [Nonomuraea angiospora]|uniref:Uncharacterized protein n=1 Tax=Nonomuraea angiospora TaxID=46172 RepID=A0ABR9MEJ4_9ACTN|nr:hypothetical protein [Nonomuraea angiospora]